MGTFRIGTPSVSIARELWRFGEPQLSARAAELSPREAALIGVRAGEIVQAGEVAVRWPDGPREDSAALMLAATEHLEGKPRPCARSRRLPAKRLPLELQVSEEKRWEDLRPVSHEMDRMLAGEPLRSEVSTEASRSGDAIAWPGRWQPEAREALAAVLGTDARIRIVVGDPENSLDGAVLEGFVYLDGEMPTIIFDRSGRPDVYPGPLLSGPVLRIYELVPRRKPRLLYAHPNWQPRNGR